MNSVHRVFVVARLGWNVRSWNESYTHFWPVTRDTAEPEDRQFVPIAAFADRVAAEVRLRELELEAARVFNPFWALGHLSELTTLPAPELMTRLAASVSSLPDTEIMHTTMRSNRDQWLAWWDDHIPSWSDETLATVWELFDAVRFYAILEVEAE